MSLLSRFRKEAPVTPAKPVDMGALIDAARDESKRREEFRTRLPESARRKHLEKEIFEGREVYMSTFEKEAVKEFLPANRKKA